MLSLIDIMIRNIIRKSAGLPFYFRIVASINTKKQFLEKLANKQYAQILGINDNEKPNFKGKDLHKAYLQQIRRYHSDLSHDEISRKQHQQITKCITQAFEELKKQDPTYWKTHKNQTVYTLEDEVSQSLFNKSFQQIKHTLYQEGNEQMRKKFVDQIQKRRQSQKDENSNVKQTPFQQQSYSYRETHSEENNGAKAIGGILLLCLGAMPFFYYQSIKSKPRDKDGNEISIEELTKDSKVVEYTEEDYDIMIKNASKVSAIPEQKFINALLKRRPHMLSYPPGKDPDIFEQLSKYSIAPDIHLFQVPSKYFLDEQQADALLKQNTVQNLYKYPMKQTKPNTLLSLSLEAERVLQNIYVKVDDVVNEVKKNGNYTPPTILFKFKGYIMFQIRDKTFSTLQSYRNTKYISLFDLYFDYYSPIFFKRNYYNMYLVGFDEEQHKNTRYFGNVQLNHRLIPSVYLQKGQKVVVMRNFDKLKTKFGKLKESEIDYQNVWQNYYESFEKKWKEQCLHQAPS